MGPGGGRPPPTPAATWRWGPPGRGGLGGPAVAGGAAISDASGRFELLVPDGEVQLELSEERHQPLQVALHLGEGQRVSVEYRLSPRSHGPFEVTIRGEAKAAPAVSLGAEDLQNL